MSADDSTVVDPNQLADLLVFEETLKREYLKLKHIKRKYTGMSRLKQS